MMWEKILPLEAKACETARLRVGTAVANTSRPIIGVVESLAVRLISYSLM